MLSITLLIISIQEVRAGKENSLNIGKRTPFHEHVFRVDSGLLITMYGKEVFLSDLLIC